MPSLDTGIQNLLGIGDRLRLKALNTLLELVSEKHFLVLLGVDSPRLRQAMREYLKNKFPENVQFYTQKHSPFDLTRLVDYYTNHIKPPDFLIADLWDEEEQHYRVIADNLIFYRGMLATRRMRVLFILPAELLNMVQNRGYEFHSFSSFSHYFHDLAAESENNLRPLNPEHPKRKQYQDKLQELHEYEQQPNASPLILRRILLETARRAEDVEEFKDAETMYRRYLNLLNENQREDYADAIDALGVILGKRGKLDEALKYFREALDIYRELGERSGEAVCLGNIGLIFYNRGELNNAMKHYREALDIYRKLGERSGIASTYNNIGRIFKDRGEPDEAIKNYREALDIYRELGERSGIASTYNNIGRIFKDRGELNEAMRHYREALDIYRELGERSGIATSLNNIGIIFKSHGELNEAMKHYREALDIYRKLGERSGIASTYN
ncbi:MAG: hypothetical protein B0D92_07910, partial [Spirochaeta sp. LUC14_002_19_P3]